MLLQQRPGPLLQRKADRNGTAKCAAARHVPAPPLDAAAPTLPLRRRLITARTAEADAAGAVVASDGAQAPAVAGGEAMYVRSPLVPGQSLSNESGAVVVLGDLPGGATVKAAGDVIVMGRIDGAAQAGAGGFVAALGFGPGARVSVGGIPAAKLPSGPGQAMAVLEDGAVAFKPLPGQALGPSTAAEDGDLRGRITSQLVPAAALALGLALTAAPSAVLGGLLGAGGAESAVAALLEVAVYGYILLKGASLLAEGSELLLEVVNPGIIGGVLLPVLGTLPDAFIVANSGLKGTPEMAQEQLAIGMGTLAGSTVLLLSLTWGASVLLGRCDINPNTGRAVDKTLSRGFDLQRTGVSTEDDVRRGAAVMAGSALLYAIIQVPAFLNLETHTAALTGAIACSVAAVGYCVYSVVSPELQKRRIEAARKQRLRMFVVKALAERTVAGALVDAGGRVNRETLLTIFADIDRDGDGKIDSGEVAALLLGLRLADDTAIAVDTETVDAWIADMDTDGDKKVTLAEFEAGFQRWVAEKIAAGASSAAGRGGVSVLLDPRLGGAAAALLADLPPEDLAQLKATAAAVEAESPDEAAEDMAAGPEGDEGPVRRGEILIKAGAMLAGGVALCSLFSDPLVDALGNLSRTSGVPGFFVGFTLTPLASNSAELVSSLRFAARRRISNMSLTLAQIYGSVTLNNTLVLGLLLWVVWARGLPWVYSSEVTVIVCASLLVGWLGSSRSTFQAGWALPIMALYPLALVAVHLLDTKLGWQ